jgi:hypothetical protein
MQPRRVTLAISCMLSCPDTRDGLSMCCCSTLPTASEAIGASFLPGEADDDAAKSDITRAETEPADSFPWALDSTSGWLDVSPDTAGKLQDPNLGHLLMNEVTHHASCCAHAVLSIKGVWRVAGANTWVGENAFLILHCS